MSSEHHALSCPSAVARRRWRISEDGRGSGQSPDVDLVTDPLLGREAEAFDAWRIRWFLDEAADDGYSNEDIVMACTQLVREGYLRKVVEGRWFALPDAPGGPSVSHPHMAIPRRPS